MYPDLGSYVLSNNNSTLVVKESNETSLTGYPLTNETQSGSPSRGKRFGRSVTKQGDSLFLRWLKQATCKRVTVQLSVYV